MRYMDRKFNGMKRDVGHKISSVGIFIRLILMALILCAGYTVCEKMTEQSAEYYYGN